MSSISRMYNQMSQASSTSSLLDSVYSGAKSSNTGSIGSSPFSLSLNDSLLGMYGSIYGLYGKNTANTSAETQNYITDLKSGADKIKSSLNKLNAKGSDTVFNKMNAVSDNSAVSAEFTGTTKPKDDIKVNVSQIAKSQKNEGTAIRSDASTLRNSSLTIATSDGKNRTFSVNSSYSDTNKDTLTKLASSINSAKMGVSARVETDSKKGTSKLILEGEKTGSDNTFTVSGSLANTLGVSNATRNSQDAIYSINGGEQQISSSNTVKVNGETKVTFNNVTEKDATISFSKNDTGAINATRELVNNFNALLDTAQSFSDRGASTLSKRLEGIASTYKASLSKIGISQNSNGYLEIDESKMKTAAENGDLSKFFGSNSTVSGNQNYGFSYRLNTLADEVSKNPTSYLSQQGQNELKASNNYFAPTNYVSPHYINSYYNLSTTGMLFSAMF